MYMVCYKKLIKSKLTKVIMITFERRKKDCLSRNDKSHAQAIDPKIRKLCDKINKQKEMYTTSSCGGRIVLMRNIIEKKPGLFYFVSHDKIGLEQLEKELEKASQQKESLFFKQESCILVVACSSLELAKKILSNAREKAGWKNSGIMTLDAKRVLCELRSTEHLALPIMEKGKLLVDKDYLNRLVEEANTRLEKTWEKIKRLEKLI